MDNFCPRQQSCPGKLLLPKQHKNVGKVLPQAAKLPGTSGVFPQNELSGKSSAPGSEAAWDKWFLLKKNEFLEKNFPRQRSCPGQVACSKKRLISEKTVLPQAAKLPGPSGLFEKKSDF